jgi:uncharacterized protein (TIGR00661 family)
MKVLFCVSGIGYGDATREHSNIEKLVETFPSAKIMVAGYDNSYHYFRNLYMTIKIRGYKLPGTGMKINVWKFAMRNFFLPAFWFYGTLKVRLQAFNFVPDIIVSDFEPVGISLAKVLNKKCLVVFGFDPGLYKEYKARHKVNFKMRFEAEYFERLYDQADHVLVPTFRQRAKKHLRYSYINPVVRKLPTDFAGEKEIMKELGLKKKPILVMLGGSNFGAKLAKYINRIAAGTNENFIIFGGSLQIAPRENVEYIRYTSDFFKYLKVAKAVITLAGQQTLAEALVFKKPVLCFPIEDHIEQVLNAYALRKIVQVSHEHGYKSVKENVSNFLNNLGKIRKRVIAYNLKGNGSETFVEAVEILSV